MEPIETDMEYGTVPRPARPDARLNMLLIFPIIGFLILLFFIAAALFQINISGVVDPLVGLMLLFFFVFIIGLFWALAPRGNYS